MPTGKGLSKGDHPGGAGPAVKDPEDGLIRTPRGLLTSGAFQMPTKQLAGLMSTLNEDNGSHNTNSDIGDGYLNTFPSMGGFSTMGSINMSASDAGEDIAHRTFPGEVEQVCFILHCFRSSLQLYAEQLLSTYYKRLTHPLKSPHRHQGEQCRRTKRC
jgi:hypothetical protein